MVFISASFLFDLLAVVVTITLGITAYLKWKLTYWDKRGLPTLPPKFPFGNTQDLLLGRKAFGEQFADLYKTFKTKNHKHAGIYFGAAPWYLPIHPEIIKNIMQNNFQHFVNHGNYINERDDPLSGHLFSLKDVKWRNMRAKLTPTFTSGKMKMMFQTISDCAFALKDVMDDAVNSKASVDIKDILGRFTTDVIGSTAFGINCNSLKNPDAEFRKYGRRVFELTTLERFKVAVQFVVPHDILRAIRFKIIKQDVEDFFLKAVRETVDYREKNNVFRKDFMHLLLQLKNRGKINDDENVILGDENEGEALTMNELAAQVFVFFVAGFETSSATMSFALYELAKNSKVLEKLREEVNSVLKKYDGKVTYESIMEMTYMDKVLYETLRKHPSVPFLSRKCTKDYTIPNTNVVIKKDINVVISLLGLHRDPEYYPDPEKFDPDRFSEENLNSRPAFTWLPFGEGPRVCIGLRFGMLQSKVGLVTLLRNYDFKVNSKTLEPLEYAKKGIALGVAGGIWLDVEKLG